MDLSGAPGGSLRVPAKGSELAEIILACGTPGFKSVLGNTLLMTVLPVVTPTYNLKKCMKIRVCNRSDSFRSHRPAEQCSLRHFSQCEKPT